IQLEERKLLQKCLAWFKQLKTRLEFLQQTNRRYEIAFQIFFQEEYEPFRMKMYHNVNQLQWQLESKYLHLSYPKSCLDALRTPFKNFFYSKEGIEMDDNLVAQQCTVDSSTSSEQQNEHNSLVEQKDTVSLCSASEEQHMQQLQLQLQARSQK
ncbi:hypothetical protein Tco_0658252, partial [Tanacetum coccineum]